MIKRWLDHRSAIKKCAKGLYPSYYCDYLNKRQSVPSKQTPFEELRFVVLDTETTGFNMDTDVLVSIGAIEVIGFEINLKHSIEMMVKRPKVKWNNASASIHEIIKAETLLGMEKEDAARAMLEFLNADVFVAHHTGFDRRMIRKMIRGSIADFNFYNPIIDTAVLAQKIDAPIIDNPYAANRYSYTLDALIERFDLLSEDRHTAWGDAFTTAHLLVRCLKKLKKSGYSTLGDLMKL